MSRHGDQAVVRVHNLKQRNDLGPSPTPSKALSLRQLKLMTVANAALLSATHDQFRAIRQERLEWNEAIFRLLLADGCFQPFQRQRLLQRKLCHSCAPQAFQMGAAPEPLPDIVSEGADVCTAGTFHRHASARSIE